MPKPEAPVDHLTHYPLPFVPSNDLPPVPQSGDYFYSRSIADFHHPIFERAEIIELGLGGKAARDSRIQWVWRRHHVAFHREWGGLTEHLPDTPVKQYRTTVFGVAGYIPDHGIDFSKRTPKVVELSRWQREQLRRSGQLMVGNDGARVRRFLLDYSIQNGSAAVSPNLVDEFLDLATSQRRPERVRVLADTLLQQTVDPIVTPGMRQIYAYTKKHEMLRPGLPSALGSLIRAEILAAFSRDKFIRVLADRFSALRTASA